RTAAPYSDDDIGRAIVRAGDGRMCDGRGDHTGGGGGVRAHGRHLDLPGHHGGGQGDPHRDQQPRQPRRHGGGPRGSSAAAVARGDGAFTAGHVDGTAPARGATARSAGRSAHLEIGRAHV